MGEPPRGLDEQEIAMLDELAAAALHSRWTLYPIPNGEVAGPFSIGPVEEPEVTLATADSVDDARFIVAVRNYLPAVMDELKPARGMTGGRSSSYAATLETG